MKFLLKSLLIVGMCLFNIIVSFGQSKLSPSAQLLAIQREVVINKFYPVVERGGVKCVPIWIYGNNLTEEQIFSHVVRYTKHTDVLYTADVLPENILPISKLASVNYIEVARKVSRKLDAARVATKVNEAQAGTGLSTTYTGNGVLVGVIDGGFEYNHPMFYYKPTAGNQVYRVLRAWEQGNTVTSSASAPAGYSYGKEFIGQSALASRGEDKVKKENNQWVNNGSHATHVSGIAMGGGDLSSASAANNYRGVAFKSDAIFVSTDFSDAGIADALTYIFDHATSLNKPAVVNLSLGSHIGPHDGTSAFDVLCNTTAGAGKIIVGAAGNEGGDKIHIRKTFSTSDSVLRTIMVSPDNTSDVYCYGSIWASEPDKSFKVLGRIINNNTGNFDASSAVYNTSAGTNAYSPTLTDSDNDNLYLELALEPANPTNNKANAMFAADFSEQNNSHQYFVLEVRAKSGTIDIWVEGATMDDKNRPNPYTEGTTDYTVGEIGGTGQNIISVGAFTTKNSYTSASGSSQTIYFPAALGAIAPFSSKGPTADGRVKPDITAPGNVVVSGFNRFDSEFNNNSPEVVKTVSISGTTHRWGAFEGTSMASPMVTGIVALMLEAVPNATPNQIKNALKQSAITDSYTGTIGNGSNTWGQGKINAQGAIQNLLITGTNELKSSNRIDFYPNPAENTINLIGISADEVIITDLQGRRINVSVLPNNQIDISHLRSGFYLIQTESAVFKLMKQ